MGTMVCGIFQSHDALVKLTESLRAAGFNTEHLRAISDETPSDDLIRTGVKFVYSGDAEAESIGTGSGIITSFGGTAVPGLTEGGPTISTMSSSHSKEDLLSDLEIPGSRWEDYCKALDAGRSVAGFNGGTEVEKVRSLFSAAGGNPVDVF